jgi:squalene cyclase
VSPVWDTAWACIALQQIADERNQAAVNEAFHWLGKKQLLNGSQDWSFNRPRVRGGGWPFQFTNSHYPDLDDTAAVAYVMHKSGDKTLDETVQRAAEWICGMQSTNGGFAAFDADNDHTYLNEIPFADHGALRDPATRDVSGRCVMLLAQLANSTECRSAKEIAWIISSVLNNRTVHGLAVGHELCLRHLVRSEWVWKKRAWVEKTNRSGVRRLAQPVQRADGGGAKRCDTYF